MLPSGGCGVSNGANGFSFHLRLSTLDATLVLSLNKLFEIAGAICQKNYGLRAFGGSILEGSTLTELCTGVGGCAVDFAKIY
jgi:hypothetical protein